MFKKVFLLQLILIFFKANSTVILHNASFEKVKGEQNITINMSKPVNHAVFTINKSRIMVIELKDKDLVNNLAAKKISHKDVKVTGSKNKVRLEIKFNHCVIPKEAMFVRQSNGSYNMLIKIDNCDLTKIKGHKVDKDLLSNSYSSKKLIVAIDAGHGGKDPGAVGKHGMRESDLTLQVAKKLARKINASKDLQAVLIRNKDEYIPLKDRTKIAKLYNADVFISLHADAFHNKNIHGAGTFVFSKVSEDKKLLNEMIKHENHPVELYSELPKDVLYDLAETKSSRYSVDLAKNILEKLGKEVSLHKNYVEKGMFVVLRHTDMPAVLVELGFISHAKTEKKMSTDKHQAKLVTALYNGLQSFKSKHSSFKQERGKLAGFSRKLHIVSKGETLSSIARKYDTDVHLLKSMNRLNGSIIKVGARLTIPAIF